jgi:lipopolysaccharide transport system ATP-binding protein
MSELALAVRNAGKRYTLGRSGPYRTLRESLVDVFTLRAFRLPAPRPEPFWALRDLSFEVRKGEVVGIVGRNGAGKSTLLKILARITELTEGEVEIRGRIGSLLEVGTGFHPELTGRENVFLNGAILGMGRAETRRKLDEIVAFAEVERFLDTPVKHFSSGMYMRLAFAVAAHLEPDILLVDEVLAVGDAQFQRKCLGKMDDVAKSGRTVLFVSHNIGAIRALCSKVLWLDQGRKRDLGAADRVTIEYMSDASMSPGGRIASSQHLRGNQSAVWDAATVLDAGDSEKASFLIGEPIRIRLRYERKRPVAVTFWVLVTTGEGVVILSAFSRDNDAPRRLAERGQVDVDLAAPTFLPGTYVVSAGMFDRAGEMVDWADAVARFDVLAQFADGSPFDHRLGITTAHLEWRTTDPED